MSQILSLRLPCARTRALCADSHPRLRWTTMESDECFEPTSALEWLKGDSSYSDTGSEEGEQFEGAPAAGEQSSARVGIPPAPPSAPDGGPGGPAVRDIAWRNYRRTLEWRCRWVELRVLELRGQEAHYAGLEARLLERKRRLEERQTDTAAAQAPAAEGEGGVVRCAASSTPRALLLAFAARMCVF